MLAINGGREKRNINKSHCKSTTVEAENKKNELWLSTFVLTIS